MTTSFWYTNLAPKFYISHTREYDYKSYRHVVWIAVWKFRIEIWY